ncbi:hypothetical protein L2E82_05695 [Cichorium intybus]|uniref:Uncharacterized protein n=1 Tax=Cichorium intybus TaxID=13427 RepID=A0ACB9HA56_CICIN|nr:hypothetical protein L2E82_05695 [Cichorium intybus]
MAGGGIAGVDFTGEDRLDFQPLHNSATTIVFAHHHHDTPSTSLPPPSTSSTLVSRDSFENIGYEHTQV